ncbi:MAG: hypothetical protein QM539_10700 [Alphaproteobacteria bacterium]|nr:hypothetical protein [Alphaproteobacteria bacterium]
MRYPYYKQCSSWAIYNFFKIENLKDPFWILNNKSIWVKLKDDFVIFTFKTIKSVHRPLSFTVAFEEVKLWFNEFFPSIIISDEFLIKNLKPYKIYNNNNNKIVKKTKKQSEKDRVKRVINLFNYIEKTGSKATTGNILNNIFNDKGPVELIKSEKIVKVYVENMKINEVGTVERNIPINIRKEMMEKFINSQYESLKKRKIIFHQNSIIKELIPPNEYWLYCLIIITSMHYLKRDHGDNLPMLAMVGDSETGKTSYFAFSDLIKKVCSDANGVGRFKSVSETSIYLDDWRFVIYLTQF